MKFDSVTQWVRAGYGSSPAWPKCSRQVSSEVHVQTQQWEYEAGWIEDAGCVLSPEIDLVVVTRIISLVYWERKADAFHTVEGSSFGCAIGDVPRTPPGSETRACIHGGSLGTWEVQMLPWVRGRYKDIQPKAKSRR
jgi:hypothetical protein